MKSDSEISISENRTKKTSADQLIRILISGMEDGSLRAGQRLPSERALARQYDTTRATVQYAFQRLEEQGMIMRLHGSGTYVSRAALDTMDLSGLRDRVNSGITSIVEEAGGTASSIVLARGIIHGRFFEHKLHLEENAPVYALHRVRCANDIPVALEYTYLPADIFDDIDQMDFVRGSLYQYMSEKGHIPVNFNEKIQIVDIIERERVYMELKENVPVYSCNFLGFDQDGSIVEYTETFARCDMFELNLDTGYFSARVPYSSPSSVI